MKHFAIPLLVGMVVCCTQAPAQKPEFKEHSVKEFTLSTKAENNTIAVYNINGNIKVEGYDGDKVILEIDKKITAKNNEILQKGKDEFKVNFEQKADSIIAYISDPFDSRPNRNWKNNKDHQIEYEFNLDFIIKVPHAMNLHVSTVNGGDIIVNSVTGFLGVYNVNGAIKLTNAKGAAEVRTVNGNVEADYVSVPPGESDFKTLNGDIKISYPESFHADCQFKTFQGEFYTDFPNTETLPVKVVKNEESKNNKTVYKLNTETLIRFGNGGKNYRFETFNGSIYIKKQS
ncbi:DUF4097 family beta strand repeat-containing protein [Dyadobacter sp. NIV53]|uniref:DUF4097 family beta strand repeat-containing protein n=1 Tax=Dyadobacter sp. NIV53 TaxID=2861765 RepID=UPI001C880309|nr:DUF4097 family beta strand repeat-containing protein [Dyadobacter sp. NIV53]